MSLKDIGLALGVIVVWGVNFVAIKWAVSDLPPLFVTALRYIGAALPAVFFVRRPKVALSLVIGYGLALGVAQFGLLFSAIKLGMPAGLSSVVLQTQAFFTIALAVSFLGERLDRAQGLGFIIAVFGVLAIAAARLEGATQAIVPLLMTVLAGFFWGVSNIIVKRIGRVNMFAFVVWSSLVPPLPLLALSFVVEGGGTYAMLFSDLTLRGGLSIAFIVYMATLFGFGVWSMLLSEYPAATVAPFSLLVPVVGMASAMILLGERFTLLEAGGAVLIMAGLAISVFGPRLIAAGKR
jgi:O-acetylserine/cysteine efflux transporter